MDITKLKRDKNLAKKVLNVKESVVTVNESCKVIFPTRFVNVGVCSIENYTQVLTCFAVVVKDKYFILNAPTLISMEPTDIETEEIDGQEYYVCTFEKDALFMTRRDIAITDAFIFDLFIEIWSINAKDPDVPSRYYREGKCQGRPLFTGLINNSDYATTYQKITGPYFKRGVTSAVRKGTKKGTTMDKYYNR